MAKLHKKDMRQELIGRRIRQAREEAGLTQDELGRLYGVKGPSIVQVEKGRTKLDIGRLEVFARILNRPVEYFIADKLANVYRPPHAAILELDHWAQSYLPLHDNLHWHGEQKLIGFVAMYEAPVNKQHLTAYAINSLEHPPDVKAGDILIVDLKADPHEGDLVLCETHEGPVIDRWPTELRKHGVIIQQIRVLRPASS